MLLFKEKLFWENIRDVLRIVSNIDEGVFLQK